MTLTQIIQAVQDNVNRVDKDSVIRMGVTLAVSRIYAKHTFLQNVTQVDQDVSIGMSSVSVPDGCINVTEVRWLTDLTNTQAWPVIIKTKSWVVQRIPNPDSVNASYPYLGYIEGGQIVFVPAASVSGIIRVTCDTLFTFATDDDDMPILGVSEAIIAYATAHVLRSIQLFAEASNHMAHFNDCMEDIINADADDSAVIFQADISNPRRNQGHTFIEPYLDPFQGHNRSGWDQ